MGLKSGRFAVLGLAAVVFVIGCGSSPGEVSTFVADGGMTLMPPDDAVDVEVSWNVATLSGQVDRKSDADILTRMTKELDGVVAVVDRLSYRWDDTDSAPIRPVSLERSFRSI